MILSGSLATNERTFLTYIIILLSIFLPLSCQYVQEVCIVDTTFRPHICLFLRWKSYHLSLQDFEIRIATVYDTVSINTGLFKKWFILCILLCQTTKHVSWCHRKWYSSQNTYWIKSNISHMQKLNLIISLYQEKTQLKYFACTTR